ncbi:MAG: hypothetical protein QF741_02120 [Candidatus Peribacteraceae bacterium]|jgi:hypothetical protein|nr:hypothetical protein [Candidatus Peribacteraceae bacterium]MDP7645960.1 hypothetical protein [Candidatus Peribacteraceae bacterium]|tara:strand:+ start:71 stop:469 length:399 start_codon:yes stop_codon:yes gene_type:complete
MGIFGAAASGNSANQPARMRRKILMALGIVQQDKRFSAPEKPSSDEDALLGSGSTLSGSTLPSTGCGALLEPDSDLPPMLVVTGSNGLSAEMQKMHDRVCPRVERRFSENQKMIDRVNRRLKKKFDFVCDVK